MAIEVYNTLTRRKERFEPREAGVASIYVCGVTPYAESHIGHARPSIVWDVIRRYLKHRGYRVRFVQNFTDVDDKIIERARREGVDAAQLAARFVEGYKRDMAALGVAAPDVWCQVSGHVPEIIALIDALVRDGYAYAADGSVYYRVRAFPRYGALSGRSLDEMRAGARVEVDERKEDPMDFALWKAAKPGEPTWDSPWGPGRPGWHIECSAMSLRYLGAGFDFHGGGQDLVFPHHENEIAQSEPIAGSPFVRYWVHNGLVNMRAEKMSKSLGNVVSISSVLARWPGPALRFFLLNAHYRKPLDFSEELLAEASRGWERLAEVYRRAAAALPGELRGAPPERAPAVGLSEAARGFLAEFEAAMDDDFNTAQAIGVLFEFARALRARLGDGGVAPDRAPAALAADARLLEWALGLLGLIPSAAPAQGEADDLDEESRALIERRQAARKAKNWAEADAIRAELARRGILLEDTPQGVRWRRR